MEESHGNMEAFGLHSPSTSMTAVEIGLVKSIVNLRVQQDHLIAWAYCNFRLLGRQAVRASRADDRAFYSSLRCEAAELCSNQQVKAFWNTVKRSLPKMKARRLFPDPLRLAALEDDWHPHFCKLEVGEKIAGADLLDQR